MSGSINFVRTQKIAYWVNRFTGGKTRPATSSIYDLRGLKTMGQEAVAGRLSGRTVRNGRFHLLELVGSGGFGDVWAAVDKQTGEIVAVKLGRDGAASSQSTIFRSFGVEASGMLAFPRTQSCLFAAPKVVEGATREPDGTSVLVTEFVEGEELSNLFEDLRLRDEMLGMGTEFAQHYILAMLAIYIQILSHLERFSAKGKVHRDISPDNVKIRGRNAADTIVTLLDFGAQMNAGPQKQTIGKLIYSSPEQASGGKIDHRSDQYAAGVMFFFGLSGREPFYGDIDKWVSVPAEYYNPNSPNHEYAVEAVFSAIQGVVVREKYGGNPFGCHLGLHPTVRLPGDFTLGFAPNVLPIKSHLDILNVLHKMTAFEPKDRFGCQAEARIALQRIFNELMGGMGPDIEITIEEPFPTADDSPIIEMGRESTIFNLKDLVAVAQKPPVLPGPPEAVVRIKRNNIRV